MRRKWAERRRPTGAYCCSPSASCLLPQFSSACMPALQIARQRQHKTIARQMLVGAQVAASCVLLIVAGLLVRADATRALYRSRLRLPANVVDRSATWAGTAIRPLPRRLIWSRCRPVCCATPGVQSVVAGQATAPGPRRSIARNTEIDGRKVLIYPNWVEPGFFQTMNIPLLLGRTFYPGEKNAVIVSQSIGAAAVAASESPRPASWRRRVYKIHRRRRGGKRAHQRAQ